MKTNIKIFTVLMLALTTMPGLAEICPTNTPGDTNQNCDNTRDIYSSNKGSCTEWIKFNGLDEDIGNCEKDGTKYGHSTATHHKGCCFVFGDDKISRDPIIKLVETYNSNFNKYKAAPEKLINKHITFGNDAQLNNWKNSKQPSITALETGYDALCKKNGGNYKFKRQKETSTYICQGTKASEQPAQQSTPAPTNTNAQIGNNGNKGSGNSKSDGYTVYVKGVSYKVTSTATNTQQTISNIVNAYNNTTSLSPEKEIDFSNMYKVFFGDEQPEPSIIAVNNGYKSMCADLQNTNGIATTHWTNPSTAGTPIKKGKCVIDSCDQNHEKVAGRCQPKKQSVQSTNENKNNTPAQENVNNVVKRINGATNVVVGSTIKYPDIKQYNAKDQVFITDALNNWKNKCKTAIEKVNGSVSVESDYIETIYDEKNNSLKCRITKCKDSNAHVAPDGKSCIANEDKSQQSRSATPDKVSAPAAQTVAETPEPTVSVEENLLESDKSSANERPEHENIEKLKPDDAVLNPVAVNANDIEIKEPVIQPSEEERPEHENIEKLKPDDVALNPVAVNANDIAKKAPAIQPLQENKCDDQEVDHIIKEMATPKPDSNGNLYIEYSINYKTCNDLQKKWSEKCPNGTKSSITEDGNNIKLTCVPKDDSEVNENNENNESDFDAIVQAFEERAKQLKGQKCGQ